MNVLRLERYAPHRHYSTLAAWWKLRGDECLPVDVLPPTGAVALDGDDPVAIASIWLTNAAAAHLAFPITAPGIRPSVAFKSVELVVAECLSLAQNAGVKMVWATAENRGVDRIFERAGLKRTTPLNSYFLFLQPGLSHDTLVDAAFEKGRS